MSIVIIMLVLVLVSSLLLLLLVVVVVVVVVIVVVVSSLSLSLYNNNNNDKYNEPHDGPQAAHDAVVVHVGDGEGPRGEDPEEVGVQEASDPVVRIGGGVAVRVVHDVRERPALDGALVRRGEHEHQQALHQRRGVVGLVRPEAVGARGDPEAAEGPEEEGEEHRPPAHAASDEEPEAVEGHEVPEGYAQDLDDDALLAHELEVPPDPDPQGRRRREDLGALPQLLRRARRDAERRGLMTRCHISNIGMY